MSTTGIFASFFTGKTIAKDGLLIAGGAVAAILIMIAWMHGCSGSSDQGLLDSNKVYQTRDSLHKVKQDSLTATAKSQDSLISLLQAKLAEMRQPIINHIDSVIMLKDTAGCLAALRDCDSLVKVYSALANDVARLAESKNIIIGLQASRIDECRANVDVLLDSIKAHKNPPKFEIPSVIKYGAAAHLGSGLGCLLNLDLEGNVSYGHWGIYLRAAIQYFKTVLLSLIGGAAYNF